MQHPYSCRREESRQEAIGTILVGLPAAGHGLTQSLPDAFEAYGEQDGHM